MAPSVDRAPELDGVVRDLTSSLEHPLMNGAGCVKDLAGVERMARSAVSAVVLGSITCEAREGNAGTTYQAGDGYRLNALGMPNPGIGKTIEDLPQMVDICHNHDKPLIVSIAGLKHSDWFILARACALGGADGIELNFGCPNVQSEHPIWSFDPVSMNRAAIDVMLASREQDLPIGMKLSPFSNPDDLLRATEAVPGWMHYVATANTFPNAGPQVLSVPYGGMSGPALKPIALGQVRRLRDLLPPSIHVVGIGGIRSQLDIDEYMTAGGSAVQATTAYYDANENPMAFSDILSRQ